MQTNPENPPVVSEASLETRRLELEELRETNANNLRLRELQLAERQARAGDNAAKIRSVLVPLLSAALGAAATFGAAMMTGVFSIQESAVEAQAQSSLEAQKFSYEMISVALAEKNPKDRALRLSFLLDVGLLDSLDRVEVRRYAEDERERLASGSEAESLLPYIPFLLSSPEVLPMLSVSITPVQSAFKDSGLCELEVTGSLDTETEGCIREFFGPDITDSDIENVLFVAETVALWIRQGAAPVGWKKDLQDFSSYRRKQNYELMGNLLKSMQDMAMTPIRKIR